MYKEPKIGIMSSNFGKWKNLGDFSYEDRSIYNALVKKVGKKNVFIINPRNVRIYFIKDKTFIDYYDPKKQKFINIFEELNAILIRRTRGFVEGIKSIVDTLSVLYPHIKFFDPIEVYLNPLSKFDSFLKRQVADIPQPKTFFLFNIDDFQNINLPGDIRYPIIIKPLKGHLGKCIKICYTEKEAIDFIKTRLGNCGKEIVKDGVVIQEYIDVEKEFRVMVINGKSIGCRLKLSEDEIRNAYRGADYIKAKDEKAEELSEKAAKIQNIFFAGVDIVKSKRGEYYLLECNRSPGFLSFDLSKDEGEKDVATILVEEILSSLQKKKAREEAYKDEYDVFLCYSHSISSIVEKLHRELVNVGLKPWIDKEELIGVGNELEKLSKDIDNSKLKVILFSKETIKKEQNNRKNFIPDTSINQTTEIRYILDNHQNSTMCFLYNVNKEEVLKFYPQLRGFVFYPIDENNIEEVAEKIRESVSRRT